MSVSPVDFADVAAGQLRDPAGRRFARVRSHVKRSAVDAWVGAGAAVVTHWYGGGESSWHDGADAVTAWQERRHNHTANTPRPRPGRMQWTSQEWVAEDGVRLVVLGGHC